MKGVIKIIQVAAIVATCLLNYNLKGQNLVPNASFEDTVSCLGWNPNQLPCLLWNSPTGGSPDYFSSLWAVNCNIITSPNNAFGYQYARTGFAYCGLMTFDGQTPNAREYIQCPLSTALTSNNYYYVEFFVSPANNFHFAVDRIGACFSDSAIHRNGYNILNYIPQVENDSGNIMTDTMNWKKVSGYFYAVGGEQYLTIGNFRKDNKTLIDTLTGTELAAYYYIDDVSVIDCTITGINEQQQISFSLLQNPVTNSVGFTSPQQIQTATVFTTVGAMVKQVNFSNTINYSFDVADLLRGLYFLQVETKDKRKGIRKFVKQ